jgi:hypothetical protein
MTDTAKIEDIAAGKQIQNPDPSSFFTKNLKRSEIREVLEVII